MCVLWPVPLCPACLLLMMSQCLAQNPVMCQTQPVQLTFDLSGDLKVKRWPSTCERQKKSCRVGKRTSGSAASHSRGKKEVESVTNSKYILSLDKILEIAVRHRPSRSSKQSSFLFLPIGRPCFKRINSLVAQQGSSTSSRAAGATCIRLHLE